ncbi:Autophagy-related protein [Drosera capensis]
MISQENQRKIYPVEAQNGDAANMGLHLNVVFGQRETLSSVQARKNFRESVGITLIGLFYKSYPKKTRGKSIRFSSSISDPLWFEVLCVAKKSCSVAKMSSAVIRESVRRGKLLIHIAENGHSLEMDCDVSCAVEAVQRFLEAVAGIQVGDQLLLCSDMKLETHESLSAYKLPSDDQEVFCFNKARLQANAPPPQPEQLQIVDVVEPPPPSSSNNPHPLDDAIDPALKALPSYERQFRYHYQCGDAIYRKTVLRYENCQRLLREWKVQERALEIARRNLDYFFKILNHNYTDFLKCYSQQNRVHSDLLAHYRRDIDKLRSCKLIPALQTSSRQCLLDLVKETNLRKLAENCNNSHKQFSNKVSQFKYAFRRLKQDVGDLFSIEASLPVKDLEVMIREHQRYIGELRSIMQSLSKDVSTVKKLVDDCVTSQLSSSLHPHDAVSALGPMYYVHEKNHLPTMRACDRAISDLLEGCGNKKNNMNNFVHSYMQKIAYIQHCIKDIRLQFNAFSEAIKRQDVQFEGLRVLRGLGPAYRSCLAEVVRRKACMKLYMGTAGHFAEKLAAKRENEMRRREEFLKAQSPYIPRDVIALMGLFDTPSQCDVNIPPFDTSLLDIDIADIDRYAPESLVGIPFKVDKQGSPRSSLSLSTCGSGFEELDLQENNDSEVSELVEISGTSKLEVENAKLKAELASAIAIICSFGPEFGYGSMDDSKLDSLLKNAAEKTAEALYLKDEYVKDLQSELSEGLRLRESYEKGIRELEQKLSDQFMHGHKFSVSGTVACYDKAEDCRSEISALGQPSEHMEDVSCAPRFIDTKAREGVDESMADSSGIANPNMDSSMIEPHEEVGIATKEHDVKMVGQVVAKTGTGGSASKPLDSSSSEPTAETARQSSVDDNIVLELRIALEDKQKQLSETESRYKSAVEEVARLRSELETMRECLNQSQMNCAHLENALHETRQEAQTHRSSADRRALEYSALRSSSLKMRSLFERFRSCVTSGGSIAGFADSLRSLSQSLANSVNENEDNGAAEFRACIKVLADKVGILSRQRAELHDKCTKAEAANLLLKKKLEESDKEVQSWYNKQLIEKQANKEKLSFSRFEVHEIAAFVLNSTGHYEAISKNSSNYYLSAESVALFTDNLPDRPAYIIGQIVHIERQTVRSPPAPKRLELNRGDQVDSLTSNMVTFLNTGSASNPYGLPVGCEYFVVTVAMLPDAIIHPPSAS